MKQPRQRRRTPNVKKAQRAPSRPDRRREGRGKKKARPPHPGEAEIIAARRVRALALRKSGAVYRDIAAVLHVDVHTAWGDVNAELLELRTLTQQDAQDVRDLELARCDAMTQGLWPGVQVGDSKSVMAAVRVSERRARLLGIDAPIKTATEFSGSIGGSVFDHEMELSKYLSLGELQRLKDLYGEITAILEPAEATWQAVHATKK